MFPVLDVVAFVCINDRKVLVVKSYNKDRFYFTGGKRSEGETDIQAIYREVKEEVNAEIDLFSLNHLMTFEAEAHGHANGQLVKMVCYTGKLKTKALINSEISELKWIKAQALEICASATQIVIKNLKEMNLID